jgi:hypothetical protein
MGFYQFLKEGLAFVKKVIFKVKTSFTIH